MCSKKGKEIARIKNPKNHLSSQDIRMYAVKGSAMSTKLARLSILLAFLLVVVGAIPLSAQEPVTITWYIGLGTGSQPDQLEPQQAVVDAFNASQSDIKLETIVVNNTGTASTDALQTLIASGEAPDIVGPVGIAGSNAFDGQYLDLQPLIDQTGYDLSDFDPGAVEFYRVEGQGLIGLPFGAYPSFIYFNRDLFDEADLPYPPQEWGADYADGRPWDIDTLTDVAKKLTVDASGNDATSPDFDPESVEQWGWYQQWTDARGQATLFGAGSFVGPDNTAVIPEQWSEFFHWYYDGIWTDHFIPSASQAASDMLNAGNVFPSGRVAMSNVHLWYNASAGTEVNWDLAALPSYNGTITAKLHVDTFRILASTEHPDEAFEVLSYLIGEGAAPLLQVYGSMPARFSLQGDFFSNLDETYTQGVNWQVAIDGLGYGDNPSHESNMPNFVQANDRINAFTTLYQGTEGLDIDAELETLRSDLEAIFQGSSE
jgi:multiple sugar transport system substrate-binding protein